MLSYCPEITNRKGLGKQDGTNPFLMPLTAGRMYGVKVGRCLPGSPTIAGRLNPFPNPMPRGMQVGVAPDGGVTLIPS